MMTKPTMNDIDKTDRAIISFLQGDVPLVSRPYEHTAERCRITESDVVDRIHKLKQSGILKRIGAVIRHQRAGFAANAMVVWEGDPGSLNAAGRKASAFDEISHCYIRPFPDDDQLRLFTMIHARSSEELESAIKKISHAVGIDRYTVLHSVRELKKESMQII